MKKLALSRETISVLRDNDVDQILGGQKPSNTCNTHCGSMVNSPTLDNKGCGNVPDGCLAEAIETRAK
jgi:hypothetical protein